MKEFIRKDNGNVIMQDGERRIRFSPDAILQIHSSFNILILDTANVREIVDYRDVETPSVSSVKDLFEKLTDNFFFRLNAVETVLNSRILSELSVSENAGTVTVTSDSDKILYQINGNSFSIDSPSELSISEADETNGRFDLIYVDNAGNISVKEGTPSENPARPAIKSTELEVCFIYVDNTEIVISDTHSNRTDNPHSVSKLQLGLGNVDNTADANKPVSTAQQAAIDSHANLTNNPHSVSKLQLGLGNVDNTADADKPVSTAQQAALDGKLPAGTKLHLTDTYQFDGDVEVGAKNPYFISFAAGQSAKISKIIALTSSGTVDVQLFKNDVNTNNTINAGASKSVTGVNVSLADNDKLHIVLENSASAQNLVVTCVIEVTL